MDFRYVVCDVFTSTPLTGNQLAVFTDARAIPEAMLPLLAKEMNFSETVFVYAATAGGHARVRIFTPDKEQLRENILRSGHRPLAVDLMPDALRRGPESVRWRRLRGHLERFGRVAVERLRQISFLRPKPLTKGPRHEHQRIRVLVG